MMQNCRFAALVLVWGFCGGAQMASAQTVQPNPVSWFADFFDPLFGTGGSRGTVTFVRAVTGMPAGGILLGGSVSPGDTTFVFQVALHPESRSLTTVGVQGADVTAAGWIPGSVPDSVGFSAADLAFNDVQIFLAEPLAGGRSSELFFVSFSAVAPGTVLSYWVFEEGATARIFIGTVTVEVAPPPEPPREALVLYDDFESGTRIDPTKWTGGGGGRPLDMRRTQSAGQVRMLNQSYGGTAGDAGSETSQVSLRFANPASVTAIQATFAVEEIDLVGCASNPERGQVWAQMFGSFFNSGVRTPESHVGDVAIAIDVVRVAGSTDRSRVLHINAGVLVCATQNCGRADVVGAANLGTVLRGDPVTLKVEWDPRNDRFIVQRDSGPELSLAYTVPDSSPPGLANKIIGVNATVPNCTALPMPTSRGRVALDQVLVNASAAR